MGTPGLPVGVIYGAVGSTEFDIGVSDTSLKRLDYVEAEHQGARVLGMVERVTRESGLSYEEAMAGGHNEGGRLSAHVRIIGYRDQQRRVQVPRTPFAAGATVRAADESLITDILGLARGGGAYLGHVKGLRTPVHLSLNMLAQKHLSVLAKTGAGKSYTVGVILEEFLAAKVPLVILDPHGEYGSLKHPNVEDRELTAMVRYGVKPKAFHRQVREFAIDTKLNPEAEPLRLEGINLEAREIVDILPTKLSGGQVGVLYQAVKDVQEHHPAYTLQDVIEAVSMNKSSAKWNVLNALEALQATKLFHVRGTPVKDLVRAGQCTIINLKGVAPDIQEVVAGRIAAMLWEARKRDDVRPHILVVEEAHNFCPERGVGNAVSGPVLRTVASEGRKFGMGLVIVSQRPAKIDKNVLSQCNTQVVLKVTNPNDLKAIIASVEGITSETAAEIQRLPVGVALVAGGGLTQPVLVDVRPRLTRHGGASIDVVGAKARPVKFVEKEKDAVPAPPSPPPSRPPPVQDAPEIEAGRFETPMVPEEPEPITFDLPVPEDVVVESPPSRPRRHPASPPATPLEGSPSSNDRPPTPRPRPPGRLTKADKDVVHRVAVRSGTSPGVDPQGTALLLDDDDERAGRQRGTSAHDLMRIGRTVCHEDAPACIRCPLRAGCTFHARLQQERQKQRSGIRRLWRRM